MMRSTNAARQMKHLEGRLMELQWEREQEGVFGTIKEMMAERAMMQESMGRLREDLQQREQRVRQ
jgi:hypothetical protein